MTRFSINLDHYNIPIRGSTGALVVGKPGSGKSVLVSYLMLMMMSLGAFPVIFDTKKSDFFSLKNVFNSPLFPDISGNSTQNVVLPLTVDSPNKVAKLLRELTQLMNNRYLTHQAHWGWIGLITTLGPS